MSKYNNTEELFKHFSKTAFNIVTYFDKGDERDKALKDLEEIVTKNCIYEEKIKKLNDTITVLIDDVKDNYNYDEIMKTFDERKSKLLTYNPDVSNHPKLKQYICELQQIINDEDEITGDKEDNDDDVQITKKDFNIIDPFTKKQMTDPVKNNICGHVYDRESILSILKIKKEIRCPVIGCINKQFILEENLISDVVTRKYIKKKST